MTDQQWVGVRQRVEAAAAGPAGSKVFGALGHKWVVEDPLTQGELAELEAQTGVRLPEEYRAFLLHVGAGGAGPAYGLFPVRRAQGRWRWEGDGAEMVDLARLAEPFPDRGPDPALLEELLAQCPEEEDFDAVEDFDAAMEAWDERWGAVTFAPERTVGAIVISHLGCAQREWLIISGSHRGTIWSDCRVDDVDLAPLLDENGTPVRFARWYTDWLEKAEHTALSAP
ncbi:SMI1 / KNR4 family (SUKH-1) [Streptomyces sp. 3213]|uniref:SMI1/KNR4 family protein n=1 Tax=Streptomyces sp. 3213.3 TaxID=1855348 RepID=UPI00089C26BF|nr:SMI1/KNR4 family protein [Streptomyces sp. 3213.3]SED03151.1 SMI1 / KNR4 family (SUKH-1) [Streptomyces sp. 3213] [Streptomyces sp. 3213.3]